VTREMNKAVAAFQLWISASPRESLPHNMLGNVHRQAGEFEEAVRAYKEGIRVQPHYEVAYSNLMGVHILIEQFEEAKAVAQQAFAQKLDAPPIHRLLLQIAYIQGDSAGVEKEIQWFKGKPEEYRSLREQAQNAMVQGQRRNAKSLYQQAADVARRQELPDVQAADSALIDAQLGDCQAAGRATGASETAARVLCGDASAIRLAEEQKAKNPAPNLVAAGVLYQQALADLRTHEPAQAATGFQSILDHKGRNWGPYYSLAYLGLARASKAAGDTAKAKKGYQDFLALWKDADKDLPLLIEASKEFVALP
jgi:tetratricopeptide (TPR) repeat protein